MNERQTIWPPGRDELIKGLLILAACIFLAGFAIAYNQYTQAHSLAGVDWVKTVFVGLLGGAAAFLLYLLFIYYPLKILPRIAARQGETQTPERGDAESVRRGKLLLDWGMGVYLASMVAVQFYGMVIGKAQGFPVFVIGLVVTVVLFGMVRQGYRTAVTVTGFLLILGGASGLFELRYVMAHHFLAWGIAQSIFGAVFGSMMLVSTSIGHYLAHQRERG